ncbi:hypothetical protein [Limimaricola hongkongensis]|uniref:Uncharacterized protein n=1 Tax=Limimaricola hongkongensis DSM 17492 TaxID=1122180 RepID=A0A017H8Y0_9RHOB|nr:hypothetical protein [Limimaricola hongkongensis]EYD70573.1 hypothetical protein Lokhon_02213 [Limimaricola hongkongensis DSM 17492]
MASIRFWLDQLSDDRFRRTLGTRLEAIATEIFTVLRWGLLVGLARLIAMETGLWGFRALHWALSALLFVYLASVFMLRPEIPIFARTDTRRKRLIQTGANHVICMAAFMAAMAAIDALADAAAGMRLVKNLGIDPG